MASRTRVCAASEKAAIADTAIGRAGGVLVRISGVGATHGRFARHELHHHALHHVGEGAGELRVLVFGNGHGQPRHGRALRMQRLVFLALHRETDRLGAEEQRRRPGNLPLKVRL